MPKRKTAKRSVSRSSRSTSATLFNKHTKLKNLLVLFALAVFAFLVMLKVIDGSLERVSSFSSDPTSYVR